MTVLAIAYKHRDFAGTSLNLLNLSTVVMIQSAIRKALRQQDTHVGSTVWRELALHLSTLSGMTLLTALLTEGPLRSALLLVEFAAFVAAAAILLSKRS